MTSSELKTLKRGIEEQLSHPVVAAATTAAGRFERAKAELVAVYQARINHARVFNLGDMQDSGTDRAGEEHQLIQNAINLFFVPHPLGLNETVTAMFARAKSELVGILERYRDLAEALVFSDLDDRRKQPISDQSQFTWSF